MDDKKQTTNEPRVASEGLPDIATHSLSSHYRTVLALLIILVGIGVLGWVVWMNKPTNTRSTTATIEEEYTVLTNSKNPDAHHPDVGETLAHETTLNENSTQDTQPDFQAIETQRALMEALEKEKQARLAAPVMIVNRTSSSKKQSTNTTNETHSLINQFETPTPQVLNAVQQNHRDVLLSEGTLIPAVLESAINSDLPGLIRGIVESPVYSDDGSRVLVDAGSRLIGEYRSHIAQGQTRVFVVWSTLITPKGVRVPLASQGVDSLGRAGVGADSIDRHFWERFGNATLLSLIGAGASNIGVHGQDEANASQAYRQALSQSFSQSAVDAYQAQGHVSPTLHLKPGKAILIFVAHPLDFSKVIKTSNQVLYVS